mgnify:CR=1 FL=1
MRCGSGAWRKSLEVGQAASAGEIRSPHWVCEKWLMWTVAGRASAGQRHGRRGYPVPYRLRRRQTDAELDILRNTISPHTRSCMAAGYSSKAHIAVSLRCDAALVVARAMLLVVGQGDVHLRTVCLGSSSVPPGQMTRSNRPRTAKRTLRKNISNNMLGFSQSCFGGQALDPATTWLSLSRVIPRLKLGPFPQGRQADFCPKWAATRCLEVSLARSEGRMAAVAPESSGRSRAVLTTRLKTDPTRPSMGKASCRSLDAKIQGLVRENPAWRNILAADK